MDKKEMEKMERMMLAMLVGSLVEGNLDKILREAPVGACEEFARVWDAYSCVPVGVLFNRPNFELYEIAKREAEA